MREKERKRDWKKGKGREKGGKEKGERVKKRLGREGKRKRREG